MAGIRISAKRVQLITERVGGVLVQERNAESASFLEHPPKAPKTAEAPQLLIVSTDGGRVQTRQDDPDQKWKEDKVAVCYDAVPCPEKPGVQYSGPPPATRSVIATMDAWDALGDYASLLAERRGYPRAKQKVFISDGSTAIRSMRERCFPDAVFVLDWAHAVEHLSVSSTAALGTTEKAKRWFEQQKDRLWNGRIEPILAELCRQSRRVGPPPKNATDNDPRRILAQNVEYFRTNRQAMDYPTFRRNGWPMGSGIIEATVKQVAKRVKGTEKHWSMQGAEQTLQVVSQMISQDGRWDDFWRRCPMSQAA